MMVRLIKLATRQVINIGDIPALIWKVIYYLDEHPKLRELRKYIAIVSIFYSILY